MMSPELTKIIDGLADDVRPVVEEIEAGIKTTQGHYGRYMPLLTLAGDENVPLMYFALIRAGANKQGVVSALRIVRTS